MSRGYAIGVVFLFTTSLIWGFAFVAQREGTEHLGPFSFNAFRFLIGSASVLPVIAIFAPRHPVGQGRSLLIGGILSGLALFAGINLQQAGLAETTAGKGAFITGLYIVLVPLIGRIFGMRFGPKVWVAILLGVSGLYLLSATRGLAMGRGDALVLAGSLGWALQVLITGHYSPKVDGLRLAFIQLMLCAGLSLICASIFETFTRENVQAALWPLLFTGVLSTGVALTLQILAQRDVPAAQAALIMSMETVFGALGGWWLLDEVMTPRALMGCGLMFVAILIAQLPGVRARKPMRMWSRR